MNLRENKFSLQAEFKFYPFELHLDLTEDKCKLDWILDIFSWYKSGGELI